MSKPNWKPLEKTLPPRKCHDFMFMGDYDYLIVDVHGRKLGQKHTYDYKHHFTRQYLHIEDDGTLYCNAGSVDGKIALKPCTKNEALDIAYEDVELFGGKR